MRRSQIAQHISDSGLDACKVKLTAVLDRLTSGHRNEEVDTAARASGLPVCESAYELALFCRQNLAANRSDSTGFLTRQVSEALERIDNGNYGRCLNLLAANPPEAPRGVTLGGVLHRLSGRNRNSRNLNGKRE